VIGNGKTKLFLPFSSEIFTVITVSRAGNWHKRDAQHYLNAHLDKEQNADHSHLAN
jgi:hypothetical protein